MKEKNTLGAHICVLSDALNKKASKKASGLNLDKSWTFFISVYLTYLHLHVIMIQQISIHILYVCNIISLLTIDCGE